jgi:sugar transferase (PEP-CTERM system associated)
VQILILTLFFSELICAYASFLLGAYLRYGGDWASATGELGELQPRAVVFAAILILMMLSVGLYRTRQSITPFDILLRLAMAFGLTMGAAAATYYFVPAITTGRGTLALVLVVSFLGILLTRGTFYSIVGSERFKRNVLVLGSGEIAASVTRLASDFDQRSFRIAGHIGPEDERALGSGSQSQASGGGELLKLVKDREIDEIVVALDNRRQGFPARALLNCRLSGVKISEAVTFIEREGGKVDLDAVRPSWFIYGNGFRLGYRHESMKRAFDVVASLLMMVIASPLLVLAVAAILIETVGRGPVFFKQKRVGLRGEEFWILKLRSMISETKEHRAPGGKRSPDLRVTRVGSVLRRLRVDEIPQVINVLKGEMRFVGPRPETPEFVQEFAKSIPFYQERHCVKPGMTGWAQLCYPHGLSRADARQKLQYDLFYIKNQSLIFDLLILLQTFDVIVWSRRLKVADAAIEAESTSIGDDRMPGSRNVRAR